jgi:hypothetical protein
VADFMDGEGLQHPDFEGITHERDVQPAEDLWDRSPLRHETAQPLCRWLWRLQYLTVDSCIDQRPWNVTGLALDYRLVLRVRSEAASKCWNGHGAIASHELMSYHHTCPTLVMYSTSISPLLSLSLPYAGNTFVRWSSPLTRPSLALFSKSVCR